MRTNYLHLWAPVWWIAGIIMAATGCISWWVLGLVVASHFSIKYRP